MTKEFAVQVSRAVEDIEGFESFMEEVDKALGEAMDWCDMPADFIDALDNLLKNELKRRTDHLDSL